MRHARRVQHAGQSDIGRPLLPRRDFGYGDAIPVRLADNAVLKLITTGFMGGFAGRTVNPIMLVTLPLTGIVSFNCCPFTRSPYDMLLPPPETMPSFADMSLFGTPSLFDARSSRA